MTPLHKKLGLKENTAVLILNYPGEYVDLFDVFPENITIQKRASTKKCDFVHLFVSKHRELEHYYFAAKDMIRIDGMLWISWPKGNRDLDVNRDRIREFALSNGLVDVKVASINEYWSGLKFVYRLKDRIND